MFLPQPLAGRLQSLDRNDAPAVQPDEHELYRETDQQDRDDLAQREGHRRAEGACDANAVSHEDVIDGHDQSNQPDQGQQRCEAVGLAHQRDDEDEHPLNPARTDALIRTP